MIVPMMGALMLTLMMATLSSMGNPWVAGAAQGTQP